MTSHRTHVVLVEDDPPVMRLMEWALREDGFRVEILSKRQTLELRELEGPDVAIFNMQATAPQKTAYIHHLRMLNPNIIVVDVDQFAPADHEQSERDSDADIYTVRPLTLEGIVELIRQLVTMSTEERRRLRVDRDRDAHRELDRDARRELDRDAHGDRDRDAHGDRDAR